MTKSSTKSTPVDKVIATVCLLGASFVAYRILWWSYKIRLQAIEEYGAVIHEFDPYFNYRATEVSGRRSDRRIWSTVECRILATDSTLLLRPTVVCH
jgi:hypothetical protein